LRPGNDDAIRAIRLICSKIADACIEGHDLAEERLRAEAQLSQEKETEGEEGVAPSEEPEEEGPEVVIVSKKQESETIEDIAEEE
jgi:small subunit ribosomal protein S2